MADPLDDLPRLPDETLGRCAFCKRLMALDGAIIARLGKKRAGRLLDGVQHDGTPAHA